MAKIILSTGGTGGHVFPALKLAEELRHRGHQVFLMTDQRGKRYQGSQQFDGVYVMNLHKGSGILAKCRQMLDLALETLKSIGLFRSLKPDVIIGFGGYMSAPALVAGKCLSIPLVIHESNAVLGRVNGRMAKFARFIALGFKDTSGIPSYCQQVFVGNPIRDDIKNLSQKNTPKNDSQDKIRFLIFGGSQGAVLFSKVLPEAIGILPQSLQKRLEVVLQVRENSIETTKKALAKTEAKMIAIQPFFEDMPQQLYEADLVLSRSGAMTVSEIAVMGRAAIFVPLKIAMDNHQFHNIQQMIKSEAAWMIAEEDFSPTSLSKILQDIITEPEEQYRRRQAIGQFATPDAACLLANEIEKII